MAFTAADLQRKRHELEGAPDPFPTLGGASPASSKPRTSNAGPSGDLDTDSTQAFPALAPTTSAKPATTASAWGVSPRVKAAPVVRAAVASDSFTLDTIDLSSAGRDGKPAASLSEVLKIVKAKFKVQIEASSQRTTGHTTFVIKSESPRELEKAKRNLIAVLSPSVTLTVNAPASTIASIIGPKGAFIKQIRDETGARIDIQRKERDSLSPPNGVHKSSENSTRNPTPLPDDDGDEATVPVLITGSSIYAQQAKERVEAIIAVKTSKTTQRVKEIPAHVVPFISARKSEFEAAPTSGEVVLTVREAEGEAVASGDREAVTAVLDAVRAAVEDLNATLTHIKLPLARQRHRLLTGKVSEELAHKAKCAVIIPNADSGAEEVSLWANPTDLPGALAAVQQASTSQHVQSFVIPGDHSQAHHILTYLHRTSFAKTASSSHHGAHVHLPSLHHESGDHKRKLAVDIVGEHKAVEAALSDLTKLIGHLSGGIRQVQIDWLLHRPINGKFGKKIKQLQEAHQVLIFFPPEGTEDSSVLLVCDPHGPASDTKAKHARLDEVQKDLLHFAKEVGDVQTESLEVDPKWHDAIVGRGGTTLNAIIGEDSTLSIKLGREGYKLLHKKSEAENGFSSLIVIRGAAADVARAKKEILRIVSEAEQNAIDNSHSTEFTIQREYVGRVVGAHGAAVNKLRDQLGVQVDFTDETEEKGAEIVAGKKKKGSTPTASRSRVKIMGRKENVEEAKKRILAQVEKLADETLEILKIPRQYHASLIGRNAKYVMRLEEKYGVKITFPRESDEAGEGKTREPLKADEVLVKGGKKGVAEAKKELLDAVEFEKENNHSAKFTVPNRSVARILGKGGAVINEIKDATGAQVDIDKATEEGSTQTNVMIRGTKQAVAEAKSRIMKIADEVEEEISVVVPVESKFHRNIIGARGQGLKDLIAKCGGPSDPKEQAGLVHFPRPGESADEVRLRGEKVLVNKLKVELEKIAAGYRDRVVLGVSIPAPQHRVLIGRGGQTLNNLQDKHGVQVQFPGSRSYQHVGEVENGDELEGVDAQDLVKVLGPKAACKQAIKEMQDQVKPSQPSTPHELHEATHTVPLKLHHPITQNGGLFRTLRSFGVNVEHGPVPPKPAAPQRPAADASGARIDDPEDTGSDVQWQVVPNHQGGDEGDLEWTLKARDPEGLDRARQAIEAALEQARESSHVGFLTLPDRSVFPNIVGAKGASVARLRAETKAEITVGREDNTIVLVGSESAILAAKEAILQIVSNRRPKH